MYTPSLENDRRHRRTTTSRHVSYDLPAVRHRLRTLFAIASDTSENVASRKRAPSPGKSFREHRFSAAPRKSGRKWTVTPVTTRYVHPRQTTNGFRVHRAPLGHCLFFFPPLQKRIPLSRERCWRCPARLSVFLRAIVVGLDSSNSCSSGCFDYPVRNKINVIIIHDPSKNMYISIPRTCINYSCRKQKESFTSRK